jgi:hypothetical protein
VAKQRKRQELLWVDHQAMTRLDVILEPHLDLLARHMALMEKVTQRCRDLARAGDYTALETLAEKLAALKQVAEGSSGQRVMEKLCEPPVALGLLLGLLGLLYMLP